MVRNLTILFILISFATQAQFTSEEQWIIEGKVVNTFSKRPVKANIRYESLPFGGNIGLYKGETFSFKIPESTAFRLRIEADGYTSFVREVRVEEFREGHYFTTVELLPNGTGQLIRLEKLLFNLGKADISEKSYQELNTVVHMMKENPDMIIQLEGHTDFRGNAKQNMKLSKERVKSVRAYMISRGVKKKRIRTKAFGGEQPIIHHNDPGARERNRRVEVRILSSD